jgi:hypothetical protein
MATRKVPKRQRDVNHANQWFENEGVSPARRAVPADLMPRMLARKNFFPTEEIAIGEAIEEIEQREAKLKP